MLRERSDGEKNMPMTGNEERKQDKGKLKIFFGYAAGVGKTYAMLQAAHVALAVGSDVMLGWVEDHGQPEITALMSGIELLPPLTLQEKEGTISEFDLDGALRRNPRIILVDDLAHANAPGCRHNKRYQDIKEIQNAGIDVYTTVNVQHIESLNDIIEGITGIVVGERIPDSVFDEANQVELVDIEPEELLERLTEGRQPGEGEGISLGITTVDHLVSLREIALRRMADRVNLVQEKTTLVQKEAQGGSAEHILICLSASPSNEKVIRQAARMANAFRSKFTAFYVETAHDAEMSGVNRERLIKNTRLAEQLGAKTVTSFGEDIVGQIVEYAKAARVTKIILGRTHTKRRAFSVKESFSDKLLRLAPGLEIFLIPDFHSKPYVDHKERIKKEVPVSGYMGDSLIMALVLSSSTLICWLFDYFGFTEANLVMIHSLSVLIAAMFAKHRRATVIYSIVSIFVFNLLFTSPRMTFTVYDKSYAITFLVMFFTAFVSSGMAQKVKKHAGQMARKSYRTELLFETSQKLQQADDAVEIAGQTAEQLAMLLEKSIYFYLGNPLQNKEPIITFSKENKIDIRNRQEFAVAEWTYKNNKHAGFSTTTLPAVKCLYLAVRNGEKVFAVVGIDMEGKTLPAFENSIMSAILNECAFALEKQELILERKQAEIRLNQEQLRANLLRSISHDLRTPLTSISGNANILMDSADRMSEEQKRTFYMDIYDDSMWLINLVENLLSVTRIENGSMELKFQPELLEDVIAEALKHMSRRSKDYKIIVAEDPDMPVVKMDAKLIMQVITNLVDNAIKYTAEGTDIRITTKLAGHDAIIEVADNGFGITDEQKARIFDMFYTVNNNYGDSRRGMGLGLSLCKSIIDAHEGSISVRNNHPQGTIFKIVLKAEEVKLC